MQERDSEKMTATQIQSWPRIFAIRSFLGRDCILPAQDERSRPEGAAVQTGPIVVT